MSLVEQNETETHTHTHALMQAHMLTHTHTHTQTHMLTHTHTHTCMHAHTHMHACTHTHTHTDTYTNTVYTHYAAICPTLECRSLIENCHNAAPRSASAAVWETSQRQQLLKYSPPKPSSSLATAQYTVVAAPCC